MSFLPKPQLDQLKAFVGVLKAKPDALHDPALAFFKEYLVTLAYTTIKSRMKPCPRF
jgi:hypothetical protein